MVRTSSSTTSRIGLGSPVVSDLMIAQSVVLPWPFSEKTRFLERCKLLTRWAFEYFDETGPGALYSGSSSGGWEAVAVSGADRSDALAIRILSASFLETEKIAFSALEKRSKATSPSRSSGLLFIVFIVFRQKFI